MLVWALPWRSRRSISEISELRRILAFRSFVFWRNIFFSLGFAAWQPLLWWSGGYMMHVDMIWLFHLQSTHISPAWAISPEPRAAEQPLCSVQQLHEQTDIAPTIPKHTEAIFQLGKERKAVRSCHSIQTYDPKLWIAVLILPFILSHSGQVSRISGHGWISKEFPKTECMSAAATWHQKPCWAPTRPLLLTFWFQFKLV